MRSTAGVGAGLARGRDLFEPRVLPGLVEDLWAQPSLVTLVSGAVSVWSDRAIATGGSDATQGTALNRPTWNPSGINGQPSIDFASATWLSLALNKTAGDWTIYVVHLPDGATGTGSGTGQYLLDFVSGRLVLAHLSATVADNLGYYDGSFKVTPAATGAQVLCFRLNSTGGNSASIRRNGVDLLTGQAYTQRALGGANQAIGTDYAHIPPASGQYFGKIGRISIYAGNHSTPDVQTYERGVARFYKFAVA